jgi:hypothetical protein
MWEWLQGLNGGAANFVGAIAGSAIGLMALLIGALFNAHLNRFRDDRLRKEEARAVAAALLAELEGVGRELQRAFFESRSTSADGETKGGFWVPDLKPTIRLMPVMLPKLGALPVDAIAVVVDAYLAIDKHHENLYFIARGGQHKEIPYIAGDIRFPLIQKPLVRSMRKELVEKIEKAVESLKPYAR